MNPAPRLSTRTVAARLVRCLPDLARKLLEGRSGNDSTTPDPTASLHPPPSPQAEWSAVEEFTYYAPGPDELDRQLRRQLDWRDQAYWHGIATARALGVARRAVVDGRAVLDLGAGEGLLAHALATHFSPAAVWAVDAVPTQLWAAAVTSNTPNVHFLVADGRRLPFPDDSFDLVVCNLFLHHIPDRSVLFREIRRVLRRGGSLRALEPNLLVNWIARHPGSRNERPLLAWALAAEARPLFADVTTHYWWVRLATDRLGPLSPGFVLTATCRDDRAPPGRLNPTTLEPTGIGRLMLDPLLGHRVHAEQQLRKIRDHLAKRTVA